jgi:hypothetical protein
MQDLVAGGHTAKVRSSERTPSKERASSEGIGRCSALAGASTVSVVVRTWVRTCTARAHGGVNLSPPTRPRCRSVGHTAAVDGRARVDASPRLMELARLGRLVADLYRVDPGSSGSNGDGDGSRRAFEAMVARACTTCVDLLDVDGAGIVLIDEEGIVSTAVAAGARSATTMEEIQFVVGEGPALDAHATGRPVLVPNLGEVPTPRWPGFVSGVLQTGICGVFSYPLAVSAVRLGALDLSREAPGPLDAQQQLDATALAEVVTRRLLTSEGDTDPGAKGLGLDDPRALRVEVHQAAGMVSEQLDIRTVVALVLVRAAAYASDRPIDAVAHDVVSRSLRFDGDLV